MRTRQITVIRGSGNVYADAGCLELAKADLAMAITRAIDERGLTQQAAAELMGIDQPKVSYIIRGRLSDFSVERLMGFLKPLGLDVEIVLRKTPKSRKQGRLRVRTG